jgi:hypothetical protein
MFFMRTGKGSILAASARLATAGARRLSAALLLARDPPPDHTTESILLDYIRLSEREMWRVVDSNLAVFRAQASRQ